MTRPAACDVAIVGGGVIGLSVAYALSERVGNRRIVVIEAQTGSREASWAAGGMLAPYSEFDAATPLFRLCRESAALYPEFARALRDETGLPCTVVETGSLVLQVAADPAGALRPKLEFLAQLGIDHALLEGETLRACSPELGPDVVRGLRLPESSVNNRQLWDALAAACRQRGVELRLGTPVVDVERGTSGIEALETPQGPVHPAVVVLAAGAWSEAVGGLLGITLPVVPIKGHMLRFDVPDGTVGRTLHRHGIYVIPRPGFGVVVGSTMEEQGFDRAVEDATIGRLAREAARLVPALEGLVPCECWTGLRPKPPDGLPVLGFAPGIPNLVLATGHFRNGILLTPVTGRLIAEVVDGAGTRDLLPFSPGRFVGGRG